MIHICQCILPNLKQLQRHCQFMENFLLPQSLIPSDTVSFCFRVTDRWSSYYQDWITHWPGFSSTRPFSFSQHTVNSLLDCSNKPARKCQHTECAWKQIMILVFYKINKLYLFILANDSYFSFYWTPHPTHHFSDIKPVKQAIMCHAARTRPLLLLNILTHNAALLLRAINRQI